MTDEEALGPRKHLYTAGNIPALQPFAPGQLMTPEDLNELVDAIKELDQRLRAIGA